MTEKFCHIPCNGESLWSKVVLSGRVKLRSLKWVDIEDSVVND